MQVRLCKRGDSYVVQKTFFEGENPPEDKWHISGVYPFDPKKPAPKDKNEPTEEQRAMNEAGAEIDRYRRQHKTIVHEGVKKLKADG